MGRFLHEKSETFDVFKDLFLKLSKFKGNNVKRIRSDHRKEFENVLFKEFCASLGISHEFLAPKTPEQNGVVERKSQTL